jgi:hypothetical protein
MSLGHAVDTAEGMGGGSEAKAAFRPKSDIASQRPIWPQGQIVVRNVM